MRNLLIRLLPPACGIAVAGDSILAATATFSPLGDLPGGAFSSSAFAVSHDGAVVVGWSNANSQISGQFRAFRWTEDAGMQPIGHIGPPDSNGIARAVSAEGSVVIGIAGPAFRWTADGGMVSLGDCAALGVSGDGATVVGSCFGGVGLEAAMWTDATGWVLFGDIGPPGDLVDSFFSGVAADASVACGQSMIEQPNVEPVRWTPQRGMQALGDVPGGVHYALAWAISADGATIVGDAIGDVGLDAFRWTAETGLENLEASSPGVTDSTLVGVCGDGSRAVGAADTLGAVLWTRAQGMRSLQQLLLEDHGLELPGWTLLGATAISPDARTIVGLGFNPQGDVEGWRVGLPAPADVDGDGLVDGADLGALLAAWGAPGGQADVNADGVVNAADLGALLAAWTG